MISLHNIEKSAFRRGEYVGYAHGAWRIAKAGRYWVASRPSGRCAPFARKTLREVSERLKVIAAQRFA